MELKDVLHISYGISDMGYNSIESILCDRLKKSYFVDDEMIETYGEEALFQKNNYGAECSACFEIPAYLTVSGRAEKHSLDDNDITKRETWDDCVFQYLYENTEKKLTDASIDHQITFNFESFGQSFDLTYKNTAHEHGGVCVQCCDDFNEHNRDTLKNIVRSAPELSFSKDITDDVFNALIDQYLDYIAKTEQLGLSFFNRLDEEYKNDDDGLSL